MDRYMRESQAFMPKLNCQYDRGLKMILNRTLLYDQLLHANLVIVVLDNIQYTTLHSHSFHLLFGSYQRLLLEEDY